MAAICNTVDWREFFAEYRSLPEIWDVRSDNYQNKNRRAEGFDKLLKKYQEIQPDANIDDLKYKLNCIKSSYRRELRKVQQSEISNGNEYVYAPTLWYYYELDFLREVKLEMEDSSLYDISIGNGIAKSEENSSDQNLKLEKDLHIQRLQQTPELDITVYKMTTQRSKEIWMDFFAFYRSLPEIWDVKCDKYKNKCARILAYRKLLTKYQEFRPDANVDDLKRKLNNIRSCYRRELKKVLKSELNEDGTVYVPVLWYYKELNFLRDVMQLEDGGFIDTLASNDIAYLEDNSFEIKKMMPDVENHQNDSPTKNIQSLRNFNYENDDDSAIFSKTWAALYKRLTPEQQMYANKTIMEVLYQGQMGNLNPHSHKLFESESTNNSKSSITRAASPLFISFPEGDYSLNSEPQLDETCSPNYSRVNINDTKSSVIEPESPIKEDAPEDMIDFEYISNEIQERPINFEEITMDFQESPHNYSETPIDIKMEDEVQYSWSESEQRADMRSPSLEYKSSTPSEHNLTSPYLEYKSSTPSEHNLRSPSLEYKSSTPSEHNPTSLSTSREQIFSHFIEEYKNNPCLWDSSHPDYQKRDSRKCAYSNIVNGMLISCNYEISEDDVAKKIINLRTSYFRNIRRMAKNSDIQPLWYFNKMSFLGKNRHDTNAVFEKTDPDEPLNSDVKELDIVEEDLMEKSSSDQINCSSNLKIEEYDVPPPPSRIRMSTLTEEQDENLITSTLLDGYEKFPILWDKKHSSYTNRLRRRQALESIVKMIREKYNSPTITPTFLKKKFNIIRSSYKREVHRLCHNNSEITSPLWYFDQISAMLGQVDFNEGISERSEMEKSEFTLDFIEIFKDCPCLWNSQHVDFTNQERRKEVYDIIIQKIKLRWNIQLTFEAILKKIIFLRSLYARENCKRESSSPAEYTSPETDVSLYLNKLSFLKNSTIGYQCDICSLVFRSEIKYKQHKYRHDGNLPYVCSICKKGFLKASSLKFHSYTHLDVKKRPYGCTFCDARFANEINCTVHIRRHTREYYHQCKECGKYMATSTELKTHMVIHSEERPFICETCGKGFRTLNCFNRHRKRHLKQRDYKCTMCPKAFYLKSLLRTHIKVHLNIRDIECKVCGKAFSCAKTLAQHKKLHNEHKGYVCKICDKAFAQLAGLNSHMKSHGPIQMASSLLRS